MLVVVSRNTLGYGVCCIVVRIGFLFEVVPVWLTCGFAVDCGWLIWVLDLVVPVYFLDAGFSFKCYRGFCLWAVWFGDLVLLVRWVC